MKTNKHQDVLTCIQDMLNAIPDDTGLTPDEVRLEVAMKIVENFPKGLQGDVDVLLPQAHDLMYEASTYLGGAVHPE